jgi:hypothetical protein
MLRRVEGMDAMGATVFLENPIAEQEYRIDCEEVRVVGDLVWATPEGESGETVVPLSNVTGITGEAVQQEIEVLESPGGQFTELVTDIR